MSKWIIRANLSILYHYLKDQAVHDYDDFAQEMIKKDPHAVFPTNIYRQCDGYTVSTKVNL